MTASAGPQLDAIIRVERAERHDVNAPATIELPTALATRVLIVNLSRSGCLVSGIAGVSIGDRVTVSLRGVGGRRSIVTRITADGFGCAFEDHLRPSEVQRVLDSVKATDDVGGTIRDLRERIAAAPVEPGLIERLGRIFHGRR